VLIYVHKEQRLSDVAQRYPARHYVMDDDKLRILAAMKKVWPERLTTAIPRQGHYALDEAVVSAYPPADVASNESASCCGTIPRHYVFRWNKRSERGQLTVRGRSVASVYRALALPGGAAPCTRGFIG
jgi:hypothetical protein